MTPKISAQQAFDLIFDQLNQLDSSTYWIGGSLEAIRRKAKERHGLLSQG